MAETNLTHDQEMCVESHAPYLKVWGALLVLTLVEYFYAHLFKNSFTALVVGLMVWACVKAALVGWYFMHLKFEGRWVYALLAPAAVLATVLTLALVPDIGFPPLSDEGTAEDEAVSAAFTPDAGARRV